MSESVYSQSWYQVEALKPRLRRHVEIHRNRYRGRLWYVLQDEATGQFYRFTPEAYQIIGMLDGERSLQEIWELACERLGDEMPTQDDVIRLVAQLFQANAIQSEVVPDIGELHERLRTIRRREFLQRFKSPLAIRMPLLDPEEWIDRTADLVRPLLGRGAAAVWCLTVGVSLLLLAVHWRELTGNVADRVFSLENAFLILLIYPVVKAIHELGHAYALNRWGGEVHELGIMLLVFFPVPYVDASAASAFSDKWQRMLVGAAGILVEVFIAALAMIVWTVIEPGVVRTLAFNTLIVAGASTLFFNGNPLLRFDGYYVLADYLEIPNLAMRANQYVGYLVNRYGFGVDTLTSPADGRRESFWLVGYAIASFAYRLMVMLYIALFVISEFFVVGVLLALWSLYMTLLGPMLKVLRKPFVDPRLLARRGRVTLVALSVGAMLTALIGFVPMPYATYAQGVFLPEERAVLRAPADGFISEIHAVPGRKVKAGQPLLQMNEPGLDARVEVLTARVKESEARLLQVVDDRAEAQIYREVLAYRQAELDEAMARVANLGLMSESDGVFVLPDSERLIGRYVTRGELLGYVVEFDSLPATVMISEDDIDAVRSRTRRVELRVASDIQRTYRALVRRIVPASSSRLPSLTLAIDGGGLIALDPEAEGEIRAFGSYFELTLDVADAPTAHLNERVHALFWHDSEPLIERWVRAARRLLLRRLDV